MTTTEYLAASRGVTLSLQQQAAVDTTATKLLLLAVPGAGKTTVVTARAGRLIMDADVPAEQLLILTYNRAAARDMEQRWDDFFDELQLPKPQFMTIHSFCFRLLREYAGLRGSTVPQLIDEAGGGQSRLVSTLYRDMTGQFLPDDQLARVLSLLGYCVNLRVTPDEAVKAQASDLDYFPELAARYTTAKREQGVMDFDDMLLFACTALERSTQLRGLLSGRYSHILVDEAQDTSRLQQDIIAMLATGSLFMVGDEDQSIYGFRGAYPKGLLSFFEQYEGGQLLKLEQNYRSTPEIVTGAARLIANNKQRYHKEIFTERPTGSAIRLVTDIHAERQYRAIADEAVTLSRQGSVAVLYRNSYSGIGVATELAGLGARYSASESRLGYSSDFVTRDISNMLRLSRDPSDAQAFRQVYFRLGCGISRELERQANDSQRDDILGWIIDNNSSTERNTGKLIFTRRTLAKMQTKHPVYQLEDIIDELGYLDSLERRGPSGYQMSSYVQRLVIIRRLAQDCDTAADLLERLASAEKLLDSKGRQQIRLSTVHSAKGQEYDHVIVADALEGIFPDADSVEHSSLGSRDAPEEELRLFYTAMTRARNSLTVYAPSAGFGRELLASRFVTMAGLSGAPIVVGGLREGIDVSHTSFGAGIIVELNPSRKIVSVNFRHYGVKTFALDTLQNRRYFTILQ